MKIPEDVLKKAAREIEQARKGKRFPPEPWEEAFMDFSSVDKKPKGITKKAKPKPKPKKKKRT